MRASTPRMRITHRYGDYVSSILTADELTARVLLQLDDYVAAKIREVAQGRESAHLAGLQVQKYLNGVRDALLALDLRVVADKIHADDLVASVDPDWREHMHQRWAMPRADVQPGAKD